MAHILDPVQLAADLIGFETPSRVSNREITAHIQRLLEDLGFATERIDYEDERGVAKANVVGRAGPDGGCGLAYFGHADVVPAANWSGPGEPFRATRTADRLYGRGSCDMKGSVACMLAAASRVDPSQLTAPLYITCTADEEVGYHGARQVASRSRWFQEMVASDARGVVGEPTMLQVVHAHKGTAGFSATSRGEAAHSSSRSGKNANLAMIPFLVEMRAIHDELESDPRWQDDAFDPPTMSWNIGINDHTAAVNIKAPQSVCTVYFRPMPGQDPQPLLERARSAAERYGLEFSCCAGADPLWTDADSPYIRELLKLASQDRSQTVCYGTDGGIFRQLRQLAVFGPGDIAQAHTADEWIAVEQLHRGADQYESLIHHWCLP